MLEIVRATNINWSKSYKKRDCHARITCESAHRGGKDVVGAARQEEGLAHFRVAVLCARWLAWKNSS